MTYFNQQNKSLWQSTESHILGALTELKKQMETMRGDREKDHERTHQVELAFERLKADMAASYVSRPEFNRFREEAAGQVAQLRTFCARKHGEASQ